MGQEGVMEANIGKRRKWSKCQMPQRFSGVCSWVVPGDCDKHMWNVAGGNQIAVGWDTELVLSVCCAEITRSCPTLCDPINCRSGSSVHGILQVKNTGMGCHALLQRIFPTQGSNPCLPHCRWILYQLSYQGSPRILEWVACPSSRGSSWPGNQTGVSCIAGRLFTSWATREVPVLSIP